MKKALTLFLAMAMLATLCVPLTASARVATTVTRGSTVTYTVDPVYTVTIPPTVTLGESANLTAEDVVLPEGRRVVVGITATSGTNNAFTLSNGGTGLLNYEVRIGETPVDIEDILLSVNPSVADEGSVTLNFVNTTDTPQFAGIYTGTVTFTLAVI